MPWIKRGRSRARMFADMMRANNKLAVDSLEEDIVTETEAAATLVAAEDVSQMATKSEVNAVAAKGIAMAMLFG